MENFKEKTGIEISSKNQKALKRLKSQCIEAKHLLSMAEESNITIEGLSEEIDLNETINREQFNEICKEIFEKCINMVMKTIRDVNLTESDIDKVVLTGGSSKIPKIQEMLGNIFGNNKLCKTINPDEAIALGASIFAYQINNNKIENFEELIIADIVPHALGVKIDGDLMDIIIPKNTKIPCKIQKYYENVVPYQDKLEICIYEGDSNYIRECALLDTFFIKITPREKSLINVIFEIDQKFSILKISAEEMNGQNKESVEVTREKRENARILEMIRIEEERKKEEEKRKEEKRKEEERKKEEEKRKEEERKEEERKKEEEKRKEEERKKEEEKRKEEKRKEEERKKEEEKKEEEKRKEKERKKEEEKNRNGKKEEKSITKNTNENLDVSDAQTNIEVVGEKEEKCCSKCIIF